jgi:hypothetical protein
VKRRSGEDTWRVAAWENSSVPGINITPEPLHFRGGVLVFWGFDSIDGDRLLVLRYFFYIF